MTDRKSQTPVTLLIALCFFLGMIFLNSSNDKVPDNIPQARTSEVTSSTETLPTPGQMHYPRNESNREQFLDFQNTVASEPFCELEIDYHLFTSEDCTPINLPDHCIEMLRQVVTEPNLRAEVKTWNLSLAIALTQEERERVLRIEKLASPRNDSENLQKCLELHRKDYFKTTNKGFPLQGLSLLDKERQKAFQLQSIHPIDAGRIKEAESLSAYIQQKLGLSYEQESMIANALLELPAHEEIWRQEIRAQIFERKASLSANSEMDDLLPPSRPRFSPEDYDEMDEYMKNKKLEWLQNTLQSGFTAATLNETLDIIETPPATDPLNIVGPLPRAQAEAHIIKKLDLSESEAYRLFEAFAEVGKVLDQLTYQHIKPKLEQGLPGDVSARFLETVGLKWQKLILEAAEDNLEPEKYNLFVELFLSEKISIPYESQVQQLAGER